MCQRLGPTAHRRSWGRALPRRLVSMPNALHPSPAAEPLKSWVEQTAAEAGIKYQVAAQRLQQERRERQDRQSYDA